MMKYIGCDLHSTTFEAAILGAKGERPMMHGDRTSASNLIDLVTSFAGPTIVAVEESTLGGWAYRTLLPYTEVIVSDPRQNRWIAGDENIDDEKAAVKLALLLRAGLLQPVYHTDCLERQTLKQLVQAYHDQTQQVTRFKNKLKAKFRQQAIPCRGRSVYKYDERVEWLEKLPTDGVRLHVRLLYDMIDTLTAQREVLLRHLKELAIEFPVISGFRKVPGVGFIYAVTFFAFIDTPHRFPDASNLWTYCGIGIAEPKSAQMSGRKHLTYNGNRTLKNMAKGAALAAIHANDNRFRTKYYQQLNDGVSHANAWSTVARSLVSTLWAIWRKDEEYDPNFDNSHNH